MRFKPSQEVVCIAHSWAIAKKILHFFTQTKPFAYGPKFNEIVTVDSYNDNEHCFIKEYPKTDPSNGARYAYSETCFEPVISTEELEKELSSIPQKENYEA